MKRNSVKIVKRKNPASDKPRTIVLPLWWEKIVDKLAEQVCSDASLKKGTEKYKERFEKAKYMFSHEGITNSLTPHNRLGQNPGSPQVSGDTFNFMPDLFDEQAKVYASLSSQRKIDVIRRLRGITVQLANTYLEYAFGMNRKTDFDFKKGMNDEEKKLVYIHRFYRLYVVLQVVKAISPIMLKSKNQMISELQEFGISQKMNLEDAAGIITRRRFIEQVLSHAATPHQLALPL